MMDGLSDILLRHFEAQQRQGHDGRIELSLSARVTQIQNEIAALELADGLESLRLKNDDHHDASSDDLVEAEISLILQQYIDAAIGTDVASDSIERVLALAAAVGIAYSPDVGAAVIGRGVEFSTVLLERIRGQACVLLGHVASQLQKQKRGNDGTPDEWVEEALTEVQDALIPRLTDKSQSVRNHAIAACAKFFASNDDDNVHSNQSVLGALLWSLSHDPSVANRIKAVESAPLNDKDAIDAIISRVRDVKAKVRAQALLVLSKVDAATALNEYQRVDLLQAGLPNRCAATKEAASKMICAGWIKSFKYDHIVMLRALGVMDNETEANNALDVIFEVAREDESGFLEDLSDPEIRAFKGGIEKASKAIKSVEDDIGPEQLFFLRARCANVVKSKKLTSAQKEALTAKFVPEIPIICELFQKHATQLMNAIENEEEEIRDVECFRCLQLLQLAKIADLKEEGSRRHFAFVMKHMLSLTDTPDELVEGCINALKMVYEREEDLTDVVCEVITNISTAGGADNDDQSTTLQTIRLVRILGILTVVLESASVCLSSNACVADFAEKIIPACTHEDPMVREVGVSCFGKLGLFADGNTLMSEFKPLMLSVVAREKETMEIRAQALLALSDWSMLFSDVMKPCQVDGKDLVFTDILLGMMNDSRTAAVAVAAEAVTKLLFTGRICDSTWLARLQAIFFDTRMIEDLDEDDMDNVQEVGSPIRLQQLLSIFFPAYSIKSKVGRNALLGSIGPLLEHIFIHQAKSAKGKKGQRKKITWPVVKMIQYICSAVDRGQSSESTYTKETALENPPSTETHVNDEAQSVAPTAAPQDCSSSLLAAIQVAAFLASHCDSVNVTTQRALCRLLGASYIDEEGVDPKQLQMLKKYLEDVGMQIDDTNSLNSLAPLNDLLADIEVDEESVDDEEDDRQEEDSEDESGESDTESQEAPSDEEDEFFGGDKQLSNELVSALENIKLGTEEDDESFFGGGKENTTNSARKSSTGSRNSVGSSSQRVPRKRLGAVN